MKKRRKYSKKVKIEETQRFKSTASKGLSNYQVNFRNFQLLNNKTSVRVNRTYMDIIIKNCFTFFNVLLVCLGIILISAGKWDSCFFLLILIANVSIGLFQDIKAKVMIDKLSLQEKTKVKVIRQGKIILIDSEEIVLDDVLILKEDEIIPCDGVILEGNASINESLLTGESNPQRKSKNDYVFSGTYITNGEIRIQVDKVGDENYIQKLQAKSKEFKRQKSLIYKQLNYLFKIITIIVIVIGILMLIEFGFIKEAFSSWQNFVTNIALMAGSLVSMIPSGMYLLASTTLTVGAIILMKRNVLVRDLYSVETLARVDTLCIDKTGTLTDGTMSVYDVVYINKKYNDELFKVIMSSFLGATKDNNFTAKALKDKFGDEEVFKSKYAIPFDSSLKYSAATLENVGTFVVGAFGFFDIKNESEVKKIIDEQNKLGFRTLVVAQSEKPINNFKIPAKLNPICVIIIHDHIRDGAKETIKLFNDNDVSIKVISGDNPVTVSKVAKLVGIKNSDKYISLENIHTYEEIKEIVDQYNIFGRVTPDQKEMIVRALKERKHTVAMFGDGVNDILAMKVADVSISVEAGSRAARDIANFILLTNDFGCLPDIVNQGRRVINNLKRTCSLFLTKTVFSIVLNFFFICFGIATRNDTPPIVWPFSTNSFYVWELITIGTSAFLLALQPNNERVNGNFLLNILKKSMPSGLIMALSVMCLMLYAYFSKDPTATHDVTEVAVYYISIASYFVLIATCIKIDKFRLGVLIYAFVGEVLMFLISVYSEFNILKLSKSVTNVKYIYALLIALVVTLVLIALIEALHYKKEIIEKFHEKQRKANN